MSIRLRFLLAGFCIGLAELLPGISGATVALMFGIYKKLIECISKLKDLDLLVPLLLGMAVSVFGFSKLINFLFLNYTNLFEFFIGILMIFYGAYLFLSNIQKSKRKELFFFSLCLYFSSYWSRNWKFIWFGCICWHLSFSYIWIYCVFFSFDTRDIRERFSASNRDLSINYWISSRPKLISTSSFCDRNAFFINYYAKINRKASI